MKTMFIGALAAVAAATASAAPAKAWYVPGVALAAPVDVVPARIVCDAWGRCVRTYPRYIVPPPVFYPRHRYYRPYGWYGPRHHRW